MRVPAALAAPGPPVVVVLCEACGTEVRVPVVLEVDTFVLGSRRTLTDLTVLGGPTPAGRAALAEHGRSCPPKETP